MSRFGDVDPRQEGNMIIKNREEATALVGRRAERDFKLFLLSSASSTGS